MGSEKKPKKTRAKPYSKGELNRLIDGLVHPFYEENEGFRVLDGVLHAIIEQNPPLSVKKFIRYNLPEIIAKVSREI